MITEDYVSFETAKLLKEKGFNESCYTYYDDIDDSIRAGIIAEEDLPESLVGNNTNDAAK